MAANNRAASRAPGRTPPFVLVGLVLLVAILGYNYWSLSSTNSVLTSDLDRVLVEKKTVDGKNAEVEKSLEGANENLRRTQAALATSQKQLEERENELSILKTDCTKYETDSQKLQEELRTCDSERQNRDSEIRIAQEQSSRLEKALEEEKLKPVACDFGLCKEHVRKVLQITSKLTGSDAVRKALEENQLDAQQLMDGIDFPAPFNPAQQSQNTGQVQQLQPQGNQIQPQFQGNQNQPQPHGDQNQPQPQGDQNQPQLQGDQNQPQPQGDANQLQSQGDRNQLQPQNEQGQQNASQNEQPVGNQDEARSEVDNKNVEEMSIEGKQENDKPPVTGTLQFEAHEKKNMVNEIVRNEIEIAKLNDITDEKENGTDDIRAQLTTSKVEIKENKLDNQRHEDYDDEDDTNKDVGGDNDRPEASTFEDRE